MSLDQRAEILTLVQSAPCGVREIIQQLKWRSAHVIALLNQMHNERLVNLQHARTRKRGRPKKHITCTPLGRAFLETHQKLQLTPLRARQADLDHAVQDALYTERLVAHGHSPFQLFLEVNTLAHNLKVAAETPEST
jgi:DNA-binding MarR family transcriptional regulator